MLASGTIHKTATSVVRAARDADGNDIVIKIMAQQDQYKREVAARQGIDDQFVVGAILGERQQGLLGREAGRVEARVALPGGVGLGLR